MTVKLGAVQLRIMRVLWEKGESSARSITDDMNKTSPIAHSTVQTLLRKLVEKGAVAHIQRERTFYFQATITESSVTQSAAQEFVERVFNGSVSGLVAHLLNDEQISDEELVRLRALIRGTKEEPR